MTLMTVSGKAVSADLWLSSSVYPALNLIKMAADAHYNLIPTIMEAYSVISLVNDVVTLGLNLKGTLDKVLFSLNQFGIQ
jgi:hypothetical protein